MGPCVFDHHEVVLVILDHRRGVPIALTAGVTNFIWPHDPITLVPVVTSLGNYNDVEMRRPDRPIEHNPHCGGCRAR
jgi:hypothetical protein